MTTTASPFFNPFTSSFKLPTFDFSKLHALDPSAALQAASERAEAWRVLATEGAQRASALAQEQFAQLQQVRTPAELVHALSAAHKSNLDTAVAHAQAALTLGTQHFVELLNHSKEHSPLPAATDAPLDQLKQAAGAVEGFVAKGLSKAAAVAQAAPARTSVKTRKKATAA